MGLPCRFPLGFGPWTDVKNKVRKNKKQLGSMRQKRKKDQTTHRMDGQAWNKYTRIDDELKDCV